MKNRIKFVFSVFRTRKDLLLIPLFGGFLCFVQAIADPNVGLDWAKDINVWINSFLTSAFIYMLLDLFLKRIKFFKKHNTLFMILSFFISTFVGQMLSYKIRDNLEPLNYLGASISLIGGIIGFFIVVSLGLLMGRDKGEQEVIKLEKNYKETIQKMSKHDRKKMRHFCEKALQLDDATFKLISLYQNKSMIQSVKHDLDEAIQKGREI